MQWISRHKRHIIVLVITVIFLGFLLRFNQIDRIGLYETDGTSYERARVTEVIRDNETESGNLIGNQ